MKLDQSFTDNFSGVQAFKRSSFNLVKFAVEIALLHAYVTDKYLVFFEDRHHMSSVPRSHRALSMFVFSMACYGYIRYWH